MMKFTVVVLLGLLAVAYSQEDLATLSKKTSDFDTGIFNKVVQSANDFVVTISLPYKVAHEKANKMINYSIEKIVNSHKNSQGSLEATFKNFEKKLAEVNNKCSEKTKAEIAQAKTPFVHKLEQCSDGVHNTLKSHQDSLHEALEEINPQYEQYRLASVHCVTFNPLESSECVYKMTNKHYAVIKEFGKAFYKKSLDLTSEALSKQREVVNCYTGVLESAALRINKIFKDYEHCQNNK